MSPRSSDRPGPIPPAWSHNPPASERDTFVFSDYALRGGSVDVQLPEGETILGRSLDCGVIIDSPVVSRQHAAIVIRKDDIILRDLGSRNGLVLNGIVLRGEARLKKGDLFSIGDVEFLLIRRRAAADARERASTAPPIAGGRSSVPHTSETTRASAFDLLRAVADKALALGSSDEVVRLLGKHIKLTHETVLLGNPVDRDQVLAAASYAIRIGVLARDTSWSVLAIEMLDAQQLIPPPDVVDELYSMVSALVPHFPLVQRYARHMGGHREELSPTDRFALKRLDGLERLIALKAS